MSRLMFTFVGEAVKVAPDWIDIPFKVAIKDNETWNEDGLEYKLLLKVNGDKLVPWAVALDGKRVQMDAKEVFEKIPIKMEDLECI